MSCRQKKFFFFSSGFVEKQGQGRGRREGGGGGDKEKEKAEKKNLFSKPEKKGLILIKN